jgi:hypothetical protein
MRDHQCSFTNSCSVQNWKLSVSSSLLPLIQTPKCEAEETRLSSHAACIARHFTSVCIAWQSMPACIISTASLHSSKITSSQQCGDICNKNVYQSCPPTHICTCFLSLYAVTSKRNAHLDEKRMQIRHYDDDHAPILQCMLLIVPFYTCQLFFIFVNNLL